MQAITTVAELKRAIQLSEADQEAKWQILQSQFLTTFDSLKPINLLKSTIKDVAASPFLIDNIIGTGLGLASGYVSRRIVVGASGNLLRRMIGVILQFGVTNLVAQNPDTVKTFGRFVLQQIFPRKYSNPDKT